MKWRSLILDRINRNCISCEPKSTDGVRINGLLYRINHVNQSLSIGKKEVPLIFYHQHKSNYSEIIQADKNGTAWVENSINLDGHKWVTYVWKVNKLGEIGAIYRFASDMELSSTLWPMKHDIIVSNEGKVYAMTSNKKHFKFIQLKALSLKDMQHLAKDLDPVLLLKKRPEPKIPKEMLTKLTLDELTTGVCRTRDKVIEDAVAYLNNKIYLSSSSIKNDAKCPNRIIPPYIVTEKEEAKSYPSVSYNWGGFDTIAEFNKKILTVKMKAGNVNTQQTPLLSCAAGVDCSGFISRIWGFTSKLGTYDIASNNITEEITQADIKKGDVYVIGGDHVMMYKMKGNFWGTIAVVIESSASYGNVVETKYPTKWLEENNFKLRRAKSSIICK